MRKIPAVFCSLILFFGTAAPAFAQAVLGVTPQTVPNISPTAEGPGFILPDSPLFFLDELKQTIRLSLALTPEAKVQTNASIAGERFAELRFMLDRNNERGVETDLIGISQHMEMASEQIHQAKLLGHDTTVIAKSLNDSMKTKQKALDQLALQSSGQLRLWASAVAESLALAKAEVEKALPSDLMANEIKDDVARKAALSNSSSVKQPIPTPTPVKTQ